ncbi:MAG: acyl--CoA ligase, partial [Eggerthellaceae bacterium]|nr:acyl--CoA ligase [Eggerthellaceae bacterium]
MPITHFLERNARDFPDEVALVEVNAEAAKDAPVAWTEYELIQQTSSEPYRREITWKDFDERANAVAHMLIDAGIQKGQKVAILLMNGIEWLPIYFGILKSGALAVPLNFRYTTQEIIYCLNLADVDVLFYGPEFIDRIEACAKDLFGKMDLYFVGNGTYDYAKTYEHALAGKSISSPDVAIDDEDDAAIYFSSGTTGFPKAILHRHRALVQSARMEATHHETTHDDVFLCIPPLYHTGAKMHWFGSLYTGSKAVLLKGNKPKAILETASNERCTIVWLLVPWAQDILVALDEGALN